MSKVLETKSERFDLELKADPTRSDREIGRICGVDHKRSLHGARKLPNRAKWGI
jgi:hypothetical protein